MSIAYCQIVDEPVILFASEKGISQISIENAKNLFAIAAAGGQDIYFSFSLNYEENWTNPIKINSNPARSIAMTIGNNNEIFLFWVEKLNNDYILKFKYCENNCSLWSEPLVISNNIFSQDRPIARYKNGELFLIYSKVYQDESSIIVFTKSINKGANWEEGIILNKAIEGSNFLIPLGWKSDIFISNSGRIYVVWIEGKDYFSIAFAKSENGEKDFSQAKLIQKSSIFPDADKCIIHEEFNNLRIIEEDNKLYVFYIKSQNNSSDLYLITSENKGGKWESPINITKEFSFIKNYSILNQADHFKIILYRSNNEAEGFYYLFLSKNNLNFALPIYLIDNSNPGIIFEDELHKLYLLFIKEDSIIGKNNIILSHISLVAEILTDGDADGIPDDFENNILYKFRPKWWIEQNDLAGKPIRMVPYSYSPQVQAKDGTIYGEVFRHNYCVQMVCSCNSCICTTFHWLEIHFFDLWDWDYGCQLLNACRHQWDREHCSARLMHSGHDNPDCNPNYHPPNESQILWNPSNWHIDLWKTFAHEGTSCSKTGYISGYFNSGIDIWLSDKHGTFKSQHSCNASQICCDDCDEPYSIGKPVPINVGQVYPYDLNGADWNWVIVDKMDPDIEAFTCGYKDICTSP
jgi:hypothetical protein